MYVYSNNGLTCIWHDSAENYQLKDGEKSSPSVLSPEEISTLFVSYDDALQGHINAMDARGLLAQSDVQVMRCFEDGIELPSEWVDYRNELRQLIKTQSGDLPIRPPYPEA